MNVSIIRVEYNVKLALHWGGDCFDGAYVRLFIYLWSRITKYIISLRL